jgi:KaiC/GvpD/RAD55 family RecA-like ATPase
MRESGLIEDEIKAREKDVVLEATQAKVKTGNTRLDDLLLGGIPFGSNIMVHGPPFVGKEVLVNTFIAEGLKKGIPALWVITDKTPKDVREEMKFVLSGYDEYERKGLVRYIDAFSRSMGDDSKDEFTTYIDEPTDHEKISEAVENITKGFRENHEYYRMAFRSISTLIAYSDPNTAFRFLSPLCGKRKRDKAVSMFTVEKGMHGEQEIQMLGSIMDGMIDFKVDQLKTFFSVQGISEVQSRAYIRYTASKHALQIGSFALDHIR